MPIYEFRCGNWGRVSSVFLKSTKFRPEPFCEYCYSTNAECRMISIATGKAYQPVRRQYQSSDISDTDYSRTRCNIGRNAEHSVEKYGTRAPLSARAIVSATREGNLPKVVD